MQDRDKANKTRQKTHTPSGGGIVFIYSKGKSCEVLTGSTEEEEEQKKRRKEDPQGEEKC